MVKEENSNNHNKVGGRPKGYKPPKKAEVIIKVTDEHVVVCIPKKDMAKKLLADLL